MIDQEARVLAVQSGTATLAVERQSACGGCKTSGGCGTALIANWLPKRELTLQVDDSLGVTPGDLVVVGLDDGLLQRFALRLYALPLLGLLGGAVLGQWLGGQLGMSPELASIVLGLFGLIAALNSIRHSRVGLGGGNNGDVKLLRVVKRSPAVPFRPGVPIDSLRDRQVED